MANTIQKITSKDSSGTTVSVNAAITNLYINDDSDLCLKTSNELGGNDINIQSSSAINVSPKGATADGKLNKISFQHGGGKGLEFGTFDTKVSSLYTDQYRFNKNASWYMATRNKIASDKAESGDNTTSYKYQKQNDGYYDVINENDESCSTKSIIKTAHDLNEKYMCQTFSNTDSRGYTTQFGLSSSRGYILSGENAVPSDNFNDENVINLKSGVTYQSSVSMVRTLDYLFELGLDASSKVYQNIMNMDFNTIIEIKIHSQDKDVYADLWYVSGAPSIWFDSDGDAVLKAYNNVKLQSINGSIKLNGNVDFGNIFKFGDTTSGITANKTITTTNSKNSCDILKVRLLNYNSDYEDSSANPTLDTDFDVPAFYNHTGIVEGQGGYNTFAQCSIADVIKLIAYMKNGKLGPWSGQ